MKYIAILMVVILLAAIGGIGYVYMTANLALEATGLTVHTAQEQQATFADLKRRMEAGTVLGTVFDPDPLGDVSDYSFYTYTFRLRNDCFLPLDMIEVQIVPVEGDVLQMASVQQGSLPAQSRGDTSATILTRTGTHQVREVLITYYVWGVPFTLRETYG